MRPQTYKRMQRKQGHGKHRALQSRRTALIHAWPHCLRASDATGGRGSLHLNPRPRHGGARLPLQGRPRARHRLAAPVPPDHVAHLLVCRRYAIVLHRRVLALTRQGEPFELALEMVRGNARASWTRRRHSHAHSARFDVPPKDVRQLYDFLMSCSISEFVMFNDPRADNRIGCNLRVTIPVDEGNQDEVVVQLADSGTTFITGATICLGIRIRHYAHRYGGCVISQHADQRAADHSSMRTYTSICVHPIHTELSLL